MTELTENETTKKGFSLVNLPLVAQIAILAVAIVVGFLVGRSSSNAGTTALGKATLSEGELGTIMATYTYNGATKQVTAKEVIEQKGALDSIKTEDGTYPAPTSDDVLLYARNQIVLARAEAEGINLTDEDLAKYAEQEIGTSDYAEIATSYGTTEEKAKETVRKGATLDAFRNKVMEFDGEEPTAPEPVEYKTTGEDGKELSEEDKKKAEDEANNKVEKKYADYIIKLVGDEWDSEKNTWKDPKGTYATALAKYEIKADGASYAAAQIAYATARQAYNSQVNSGSSKWSEYVNELLNNSVITLNSMSISRT